MKRKTRQTKKEPVSSDQLQGNVLDPTRSDKQDQMNEQLQDGYRPNASTENQAELDADATKPSSSLEEKKSFDEEYASEVAPQPSRPITQSDAAKDETGGATIGMFALILSIVSLFILPSILGPVGAVAGFIAYYRGSKALGVWSIAIGLISFMSYFILSPLFS